MFEFRADLKQVREHPLPRTCAVKAIADGPMPFVFGIEAAKTKARFGCESSRRRISKAIRSGSRSTRVRPRRRELFEDRRRAEFEHNNGQVTKLERLRSTCICRTARIGRSISSATC